MDFIYVHNLLFRVYDFLFFPFWFSTGSYTSSQLSLDGSTTSTSNSLNMKFDPSGYRTKDPLRKQVFHTNPYITCSNCNLVNFVDVVVLRTMIAISDGTKYCDTCMYVCMYVQYAPEGKSKCMWAFTYVLVLVHIWEKWNCLYSDSDNSYCSAGSKEMRLRKESLPPCLNCRRADCFVIGSHDFSKEIAARSGCVIVWQCKGIIFRVSYTFIHK